MDQVKCQLCKCVSIFSFKRSLLRLLEYLGCRFSHTINNFFRVHLAETTEEYWDCHNHFMLYYGRDIQPMKDAEKKKKKDKVP